MTQPQHSGRPPGNPFLQEGPRFAWVLSGQEVGPDPQCDIDLMREPAAGVIPTVGSLVPNWVLVIPRTQCISFARLPQAERQRCLAVIQKVAASLGEPGQRVYFFEHGGAKPNSLSGCGVDQAHAHVASLPFDLLAATKKFDDTKIWTQIQHDDPWVAVDIDNDYLLLSDFTSAYSTTIENPESQFFRRVIASEVGLHNQWDYKRFPFYENVTETADYFQKR